MLFCHGDWHCDNTPNSFGNLLLSANAFNILRDQPFRAIPDCGWGQDLTTRRMQLRSSLDFTCLL